MSPNRIALQIDLTGEPIVDIIDDDGEVYSDPVERAEDDGEYDEGVS